jgi:hypothetical protein
VGIGSSDYHGTNRVIHLGTSTPSRAAVEELFSHETAREPATG